MKTVKHLSVILALVLVLVATLTVTVFALAPNDEGVYEIGSAEDLIEFKDLANGKGKKYTAKLTADIDLTGKNWTPIKVFDGTFDGDGHVISGIQIEQSFESDGYGYGMLIRDLEDGGVVKNLTLKDSYLKLTTNQTGSGRNHIGGVVGWAMRAHFENVHIKNVEVSFTGTVKNEVNVGGIVGTMDSNNAVTGAISVHNCSSDKDCSVEGVVTGRGPNVAGLVGRLKNTGSNNKLDMKDCVNNAAVSSSDWAGGLVACIDDTVRGGNQITNCKNYGVIKTTTGAAGALVCSAGNAQSPLTVKDSVAGGILVSNGTYAAVCAVNNQAVTVENTTEDAILAIGVATADEFRDAMKDANNATKNIVLLADIDLGTDGNTTMNADFGGTFDGMGYTVSGITNTVFKKIAGGTVKNVTLNGSIDYVANTPVIDARKAAALAGDAANATIENVICNVDVKTSASNLNAGGIIGYANELQLINCVYAGVCTINWTGSDAGVGAIVGYVRTNSGTNTYTNCAFTGTLNVTGDSTGTLFVGGLVGKHRQQTVNVVDFTNTGVINVTTGSKAYVGGFIGTDNDVKSLTMSGTYGGEINAPGATVGNFLAYDENATADLTGCVVDLPTPPAPETTAPETTAAPVVTEAPETTETPDAPVDPENTGFSAGTIEGENGEYTISSEDFSAFISSKANIVGGKSDLRVVLVANYDVLCDNDDAVLTVAIGGKTFTYNVVDDLHVYQSAVAAGETYTAAEGSVLFGLVITAIPNDAWEDVTVTLTSANTIVAGELAKEDVITHAVGEPVPGGIRLAYGQIESWHRGTNYTASAIFFVDDPIAEAMAARAYDIKILYNGVLSNAGPYEVSGTLVRFGLEPAITGIAKGQTYTFEIQFFDDKGDLVYYSGMLNATSECYSTDLEQAVELPLSGIKEVAVDKNTLSYSGIGVWNANTESIAQLFDGNTMQTKMGGNVQKDEGGNRLPVTIEFSLTAPTTLSYYTFYTGNDTDSEGRNPNSWVLYGKVGEEWVELSVIEDVKNEMTRNRATPTSYAVTNAQECTEYKFVIVTNGDQFQLNELVLYTNDATVTGTTKAAAIGNAPIVYTHRNNYLSTTEAYQFKIGTKGDKPYAFFINEANLQTIRNQPAWVYIKDTTNGGEYVRYEVTDFTTERHCDILFNADGFTPVEGVEYEIVLKITSGDGTSYPNTVYSIYSWGFQLGKESIKFNWDGCVPG